MKKVIIAFSIFALLNIVSALPAVNKKLTLAQVNKLKVGQVERLFIKACKTGDIDTVRLITKSINFDTAIISRGENRMNGLMLAIHYKHFNLAKVIIARCNKRREMSFINEVNKQTARCINACSKSPKCRTC